jgi:tetratricopeptide (TPR) repeat protein
MSSAAVPDSQLRMLLKEALARIDARDSAYAENLLAQILSEQPNEPDALQLMGLVRRAQGRDEEAEDFYRRSLAEKPEQANVHHNLGNLFITLERYDEAISELKEAIRLKPNYIAAHLNLGRAYSETAQFAAAEKCYRKALWLSPGDLFALQCLAGALNDQQKPREAETILRKALAARPADPRHVATFEHNLGVSLKMQHRLEEALKLFKSAQAKAPDLPLIDLHRANALELVGRVDEAVDSYRRALAREPRDLQAHRDLNRLLYRLGRDDTFLRSYDDAAALFPDSGHLPLAKGNFQFLREDYPGALESFERAAQMLGSSCTPHDGLAVVFARMNKFDDAIREHEIAVKLESQNAPLWRNFAETLMRAGEPKRALAAAGHALAIEPMNQGVLAYWGTALSMLQDPRAENLNDYERFVQVFELDPPEGYSDMISFNRDLNAYLDHLHGDRREPLDQTLRKGTQTRDNLFGKGYDLVERLRARIDEAIGIYISRMADDELHPLLGRKRMNFEYAGSWSARLSDCGFHTNHFHAMGWISSAYYVAVPECVSDTEAKQGWIKFGEPSFDASLKNPIRRTFQASPGKLVLFPSYMWHGTVPFHSQQTRTTIAFDVVPR